MAIKKNKSWQEFERLAAEIEKILAPKGAEVNCPDRIPDVDTGELREVDASIRYKVGSVPILIILECRDRKSRQGTMWIEQLSSKRASVGAAKCVAISRSPFTKPAQIKAAKLGVELRNLRRYEIADILSLAPMATLQYLCSLNSVSLTFAEGFETGNEKSAVDFDNELNKVLWHELALDIDAKIIRYHDSGVTRSVAQYVMNLLDAYYAWSAEKDFFVPKLGTEYTVAIAGEIAADVKIRNEYHRLGGAGFKATFSSFFDSYTKIDAASLYTSGSDLVAARFEVTAESSDGRETKHVTVPYSENSFSEDTYDKYMRDPKLLAKAFSMNVISSEHGALRSGRFPKLPLPDSLSK